MPKIKLKIVKTEYSTLILTLTQFPTCSLELGKTKQNMFFVADNFMEVLV